MRWASAAISRRTATASSIFCDGIASAGWAELLALCDDSVIPVFVPINCNGAENLDESATDHSMSTSLAQAPVAVAKQALTLGFGNRRHRVPCS